MCADKVSHWYDYIKIIWAYYSIFELPDIAQESKFENVRGSSRNVNHNGNGEQIMSASACYNIQHWPYRVEFRWPFFARRKNRFLNSVVDLCQSSSVQCFHQRQTMQSFKSTLEYFREKESPSLHKFVLQKMSSQLATERRQAAIWRRNEAANKKPVPIPCISKQLYDEPVSFKSFRLSYLFIIYFLRLQPQSQFYFIQLFYNLLHLYFSFLSRFVFGQFLISLLDYNMIKLEKTLDFCVPRVPRNMSSSDIAENHRKTLTETDRPMNWLFFIPALIWLRVFRFWLSAASILLGYGEVTAMHMVSLL